MLPSSAVVFKTHLPLHFGTRCCILQVRPKEQPTIAIAVAITWTKFWWIQFESIEVAKSDPRQRPDLVELQNFISQMKKNKETTKAPETAVFWVASISASELSITSWLLTSPSSGSADCGVLANRAATNGQTSTKPSNSLVLVYLGIIFSTLTTACKHHLQTAVHNFIPKRLTNIFF